MEQNKNEMTNWSNLFNLYKTLVGPFQEFENRLCYKRELEWTAEDAKGTIRFGYKRIIREAFLFTLKCAIPFLIIFWVVYNVVHVESLRNIYDMYIGCIDTPLVALHAQLFEKEGGLSAIETIYYLVVRLIEAVPYPCLTFLFPLMIVGSVISRTHGISQAKKTLKTCEDVLPQAETAIQDAWKKIAPYIKNIPPNYRNSSALAFFSNSFFNYKVKNLQEAVNLYDQYLHQQRMEQSQREIAEAQRESMAAIDALS